MLVNIFRDDKGEIHLMDASYPWPTGLFYLGATFISLTTEGSVGA